MRNTTATANRQPSTRLLAISILLALAAILAVSSAVPAAPPLAPPAQTTVDYDTDDDGLIDISTHQQLNAVRYDLNGDGNPETGGSTGTTNYGTAFPNRVTSASGRMGCPSGACTGYELLQNINLDTDGDGNIGTDTGDAYYNGGSGWDPIGVSDNNDSERYQAAFNGNGKEVQNLYINRATVVDAGLFKAFSQNARIESLGVTSANVTVNQYAGALVGTNRGDIIACYSTGSVTGTGASARNIGGLAGLTIGEPALIHSSYSTASVTSVDHAGGLVGGIQGGTVLNSYATGSVTRSGSGTATNFGGFAGTYSSSSANDLTARNYYNTTTSGCVSTATGGCTSGIGGTPTVPSGGTAPTVTGRTTTQLQSPTTYGATSSDTYYGWNANLDGVAGNDDPWDFKGASAYPTLIYHLTDYDTDEDGLIEISNLAQLNAIRLNLNGRGDSLQAAYGTAFPNRSTSSTKYMGCPSGPCSGYELAADLDFDENGDGVVDASDHGGAYHDSGAGWTPIGDDASSRFATTFKGNGHTINNLFINRSANYQGLFGGLSSAARVESVGITNANVTGQQHVGILSAANRGAIVACYTTGSVTATTDNAGGLVGWTNSSISSSYSTASASAPSNVGGLLGIKDATGSVTHSYSTGAVTRSSGTATTIGGLVGASTAGTGTVTASYYDSTTSGCVSGSTTGCTTSAAGTAQTTTQLQTPVTYTGIYAAWNANIDGVAGDDDPWAFGLATDYPVLKYADFKLVLQGHGDFDLNDNGLIEIKTLAQLAAVHHDMNGDGTPTSGGATAYDAAFLGREQTDTANLMGCPAGACTGYELLANLDFDENGDGQMTATGDPTYWNGGSGWDPLGTLADDLEATFNGNGYTIDNLYINRSGTRTIGLFKAIGYGGRVEALGITNANVSGENYTGILAGFSYNDIVACYTTGSVSGNESVGGLIGHNSDSGALVHSSYSTASVSGNNLKGGLVGQMANGSITNSYSTGRVSDGGANIGGLLGQLQAGTVTESYWDTQTSGRATSDGGSGVEGKTTAELQSPTAYGATSSDTYFGWNANIDGVTGNDDPWNFCRAKEYPILKYGGHQVLRQSSCGDYDTDDDGYIDVENLAQLNAMRYDLDADGDPAAGNLTAYNTAFPNRITAAAARMGCPSGTCTGYELLANLDFDTNGDGSVTVTGDTYWNSGTGWDPIGGPLSTSPFTGDFKGNGHTINNLFINRTNVNVDGLFGWVTGARIETVGVINANVTGHSYNGILVGAANDVDIVACYTTGSISSTASAGVTGGLVGRLFTGGEITSSYSTARVDNATHPDAGGLVGRLDTTSTIANSYSTGRVTGGSNVGGLIGNRLSNAGAVTDSYWDTVSSGQSSSAGGSGVAGKTPRELQTVTDYSGIYANWNANLDGEAGADDPWHFGNGMQYPMLKYKGMNLNPQGNQAMGIADNWNAPVAGERLAVCLTPAEYPNRGIVSGQTYKEPWIWEWSADGGSGWTVISGAGDGDDPPTYEYSPTVTDLGRYLRAKVKLADGSFAITRPLGGPVVAASGATAAPSEARFARGHAAPQVGVEIVARDPRPSTRVMDVRAGWQRCPNTEAPHSDCAYIAGYPEGHWWIQYTPTDDDIGSYLRMYVYYQNVDGTWTRRVTPFTTGVVAAATP